MRTRNQQIFLERLLYRTIETLLRIPLTFFALLMTGVMVIGALFAALLDAFQRLVDLPQTPILEQVNNLLREVEAKFFKGESI